MTVIGSRSFRPALFTCALLIAAWLTAGCNVETTEPVSRAGASLPQNDSAALLPTPTLAAGAAQTPGTNILQPPTPVIQPTPDGAAGNPATTPNASTTTDDPPAETATAVAVIAPTLPAGASPEEYLALGWTLMNEGNYAAAAQAFRTAGAGNGELSDGQRLDAAYGLGRALLEDGRTEEATVVFEELAAGAAPQSSGAASKFSPAVAALFHLGRIRLAAGDYGGAVEAFTTYVQQDPTLTAYAYSLIAQAHNGLGDPAAAAAAYEAALTGQAQRLKQVDIRRRLADLYLAAGDYAAAIKQYDAIHDLAVTEVTRGQMTYLAGQAELQAGNVAAAHERFNYGVNNYPRAPESYQGLIALVDAGFPVDEYQRGLVDFYAGAYLPGIEAFRRYLAAAGAEEIKPQAYLFLAWSLEALGDVEAALAELNHLSDLDPAGAMLEEARLLARAGRPAEAIGAYQTFLETHPEHGEAPKAAWEVAELAETQSDDTVIDRYIYLADTYPQAENAPTALMQAGRIADETGDRSRAIALWQRAATDYPQSVAGAEALVRLLRLATDGDPALDLDALRAQASALSPTHYFAVRARDLAEDVGAYTADQPMTLPVDEAAARIEAETWLRARLAEQGREAPEGDLSGLDPALASDPRLLVGERLWQLGLYEEAKAELEDLRQSAGNDPLLTYQLALYFRDLGLYRSSIIAAARLLNLTGSIVFDAPPFLGRLSFPVYYDELILPLAEQHGYDPRLQFALVRQESLFESFARSGAAAQGLSQVIPDTGAYIAQRLAWPGYVNEDLYKPYVGLTFGAYYLSQQLAAFDRQIHAALAAYNAGPGNAARWYETAGRDHDAFVDAINFPETRLYLERIYEGFAAYRHLYGD